LTTELCKICNERKPNTSYGLCDPCDEWLLHTAKSKAGRKDLLEAQEKIRTEKVNKFLDEPLWEKKND